MTDIKEHTEGFVDNWARLQGVIAMLALPEVRCRDGVFRRRAVEIEVLPDQWREITECTITAESVKFAIGDGAWRREYLFDRGAVPRWRVVEPKDTP